MRRLVALPPVALALALAACDDLRTASRDFGVSFGDFPTVPGAPPFLALEGTRLCEPDARCGPCEEDPPRCEGVELAVDGADADADGCYPVELAAPLTFTFTPQGCAEATPPESLTVEALSPSEASARFDPRLTLAEDVDEGAFELASQGDPVPAATALVPLRLLADRDVPLRIRLQEAATDRPIGWNPSAGALKVQAIEGAAPTVRGDLGEITLVAAAGARASAALGIAGVDFPLADVVGVDPSAVDRIEITALLLDGGADGQQPAQVEAHVKDASGALILGVPIQWRVLEGDVVLDLGDDGEPTDVVGLAECIPRRPEPARRATIEAAYGEHRATLEIAWKGYAGDEPYNAGPCPDEGCGCRSSTPDALALALLLLPLARRRRAAPFT